MSEEKTPQIGIVLGSKSDLPAAHKAAEILNQFNVPLSDYCVSPQNPEDAAQYAARRG